MWSLFYLVIRILVRLTVIGDRSRWRLLAGRPGPGWPL